MNTPTGNPSVVNRLVEGRSHCCHTLGIVNRVVEDDGGTVRYGRVEISRNRQPSQHILVPANSLDNLEIGVGIGVFLDHAQRVGFVFGRVDLHTRVGPVGGDQVIVHANVSLLNVLVVGLVITMVFTQITTVLRFSLLKYQL